MSEGLMTVWNFLNESYGLKKPLEFHGYCSSTHDLAEFDKSDLRAHKSVEFTKSGLRAHKTVQFSNSSLRFTNLYNLLNLFQWLMNLWN